MAYPFLRAAGGSAFPVIRRRDLRTLLPYARKLWAPEPAPPAREWSTTVADERMGTVRLTGDLRELEGARRFLLVAHGLGGSPKSHYCLRAARLGAQRGYTTLCLSLRGSDRRGEDFYNVALREDLAAALASPEVARYEEVDVLGYSMGGHVTLHYARGPVDPRVRAVAAICTPMDLLAAQRYIDSPRAWLYRRHVLAGLKEIYQKVAERGRPVPSPLETVLAVRTIHAWDTVAIAPRYGYDSPEHFYEALSVGQHMTELAVPTLLIGAEKDPIIPPETIRPFLPPEDRRGALEVRWVRRAGHVAFARDLDLGYDAERGLEGQLFGWFGRFSRPS